MEKVPEELMALVPQDQQEEFRGKYQAHKERMAKQTENGGRSPSKSSGEPPETGKKGGLAPCKLCQEPVIETIKIGQAEIRKSFLCNKCQAQEDARRAVEKAQEEASLRNWRAANICRLLSQAGTPTFFLDCSLENFQGERPPQPPVYISGGPGAGKTHLAVAYMRAWLLGHGDPRGGQARFLRTIDFINQIKATFRDGAHETEGQVVALYARTPFLILDDLGAEHITDFARTLIYDLMDQRHGRVLGATTIITSNISLADLDLRYHPRLASRIAQMGHEFLIQAEDWRLRGHRKFTLMPGGK